MARRWSLAEQDVVEVDSFDPFEPRRITAEEWEWLNLQPALDEFDWRNN